MIELLPLFSTTVVYVKSLLELVPLFPVLLQLLYPSVSIQPVMKSLTRSSHGLMMSAAAAAAAVNHRAELDHINHCSLCSDWLV